MREFRVGDRVCARNAPYAGTGTVRAVLNGLLLVDCDKVPQDEVWYWADVYKLAPEPEPSPPMARVLSNEEQAAVIGQWHWKDGDK